MRYVTRCGPKWSDGASGDLPRLVIPFTALVSDNDKFAPLNNRLILTRRYRDAKEMVGLVALSQWRRAPLLGPLALDATLYEPNRDRVRDPGNYRKLVTDALRHITYADDGQLDRETWARGPVDARNARLEITLTLQPQEP